MRINFWKKLVNPNQFGKYFIQIRRLDFIGFVFKIGFNWIWFERKDLFDNALKEDLFQI